MTELSKREYLNNDPELPLNNVPEWPPISNQMITFVTDFLFNPMTPSKTLSEQEIYFLLYYDDIKTAPQRAIGCQ